MITNQFPDEWYARQLEPWFPLLSKVHASALRNHYAALDLLGPPRKVERAGEMHRAIRTNLKVVCEDAGAEPLMTLIEEPEGQGLDYLVCRMDPDNPFAIRWGRWDGERVRRNRTDRSHLCQSQGVLFPGMLDEEIDDMPIVSMVYSLADDYTEIGRPCWWIDRLVLLRERTDGSDFITEMAVFDRPAELDHAPEVPPALLETRQREADDWAEIVRRIRFDAA